MENSTANQEIADDHLEVDVSFGISCAILGFAIFGVLSNGISVLIFSRPYMRSPINILLTGLSAIDILVCILSIPTFVAPPMCVYWPQSYALRTVTTYGTLYLYPMANMVQTASVWVFVVITLERFVAVCRPFQARWSTPSRSIRALAGVCTASVLYNLIRFFEHKHSVDEDIVISDSTRTTMSPVANGNESDYYYDSSGQQAYFDENPACNAIQQHLRSNVYYMSIYYSGLYLATHFLLPFGILTLGNAKMIFTIHSAKHERRQLTNSEKKEYRTTTMMAAVIFMFLCCNTLPFVLNFVEQLDDEVFRRTSTKFIMYVLNDVSNLLILVNASTTTFIYYGCSQKYRRLLRYYINYCHIFRAGAHRRRRPGTMERTRRGRHPSSPSLTSVYSSSRKRSYNPMPPMPPAQAKLSAASIYGDGDDNYSTRSCEGFPLTTTTTSMTTPGTLEWRRVENNEDGKSSTTSSPSSTAIMLSPHGYKLYYKALNSKRRLGQNLAMV